MPESRPRRGEMFSARGRSLSADDYYGTLAGLSEEAIIGTCLGVEGEALAELVEERIEAPRRLEPDRAVDGHAPATPASRTSRVEDREGHRSPR